MGKPRFDLLPPEAYLLRLDDGDLVGAVRVLEFGAVKYAAHSWAHVPDAVTCYRAAGQRHADAMARGETLDAESGLPHRWHLLCCLVFVFALRCRQPTGE